MLWDVFLVFLARAFICSWSSYSRELKNNDVFFKKPLTVGEGCLLGCLKLYDSMNVVVWKSVPLDFPESSHEAFLERRRYWEHSKKKGFS